MPRSRNIRLTPIQRDIMWELEEAGEENLVVVWTVARKNHEAMAEDQFRVEFVDGLRSLARLGYLHFGRNLYRPDEGLRVELSREVTECLWVADIREAAGDLFLRLTDAGYEALGQPKGR